MWLPPGKKYPPPSGTTGQDGVDLTPEQCAQRAEQQPDSNIAWRLPPSVVGIDVDAYGDKNGAGTLTQAQARWGPLPDCARSTSRDDGVSGIRFYRVPEGTRLRGGVAFPELGLGCIDVIQHHHRYAVVPPSLHPGTGSPYVWRNGSLEPYPSRYVPPVSELPELPARWVQALRIENQTPDVGGATAEQMRQFLSEIPDGQPCEKVRRHLQAAVRKLGAGGQARHDAALGGVLTLLRVGHDGHPGVPDALAQLRAEFLGSVVADGSRDEGGADREFSRMVDGPRGIALLTSTPTPESARRCRCPDGPGAPTDDAADERLYRERLAYHLANDRALHDAKVAERAQQVDAPEPGLSWAAPHDVAAVLAGTIETRTPDVLVRTDGHGLLYRGEINGVFGEPECGKTWLVLAACAEQLLAGRQVFYLDYENGAPQLLAKLRQLQVPDEAMVSGLSLWTPQQTLDGAGCRDYRAALADKHPAVVALDSVSGPLGLEGFSSNSADDFERFGSLYLRPAAEAGAAVLTIDHVIKDTEKRGSWEVGTQRKKGLATGAKYEVQAGEPFRPGAVNHAALAVSKDRYGAVREHAPSGTAGVFVLDSTDPDAMVWRVTPGSPQPEQFTTEDSSVAEVIRRLDALDADPRVGRPKARGLLKERHPGYRVRNEVLGEALRLRKAATDGAA